MLRGVNVGGNRKIKMEALRALYESLGLDQPQTFIQSGNVVFEAKSEPAAKVCEKIERRILGDFGFSVPVLLKTSKELGEIVKRNPFLNDAAIDRSKLHVTFLSDIPPKTALEQLQPLAVPSEQLRVIGKEIYLYCPDGYGKTKLSNVAIEKRLAVRATTRNWATTNALLTMAQ